MPRDRSQPTRWTVQRIHTYEVVAVTGGEAIRVVHDDPDRAELQDDRIVIRSVDYSYRPSAADAAVLEARQ